MVIAEILRHLSILTTMKVVVIKVLVSLVYVNTIT